MIHKNLKTMCAAAALAVCLTASAAKNTPKLEFEPPFW